MAEEQMNLLLEGVKMDMFIGFNIFLLFIAAGLFVLWVWALIDIITSKFEQDLIQVIWLLAVFFLPFVGVLLYLLIGRSMKRASQSPKFEKYDHLTKIKNLLDEGVITQEEFEIEKAKILNP